MDGWMYLAWSSREDALGVRRWVEYFKRMIVDERCVDI